MNVCLALLIIVNNFRLGYTSKTDWRISGLHKKVRLNCPRLIYSLLENDIWRKEFPTPCLLRLDSASHPQKSLEVEFYYGDILSKATIEWKGKLCFPLTIKEGVHSKYQLCAINTFQIFNLLLSWSLALQKVREVGHSPVESFYWSWPWCWYF